MWTARRTNLCVPICGSLNAPTHFCGADEEAAKGMYEIAVLAGNFPRLIWRRAQYPSCSECSGPVQHTSLWCHV